MTSKSLKKLGFYLNDVALLGVLRVLEDSRLIDKANIAPSTTTNNFTDPRGVILAREDNCGARRSIIWDIECITWILDLY